jgi:hypothetical protein
MKGRAPLRCASPIALRCASPIALRRVSRNAARPRAVKLSCAVALVEAEVGTSANVRGRAAP